MKPVEIEILGAILGHVDGTMEPQKLEGKPWQADQQARRAFRESGGLLAWTNEGTGTDRKRRTRALASLSISGLVNIADGGRRVGLTREGDDAARKLCRLPTLDDSMPLLDHLTAAEQDATRWRGFEGEPGWMSEGTLCGMDPIPDAPVGGQRVKFEKVETLLAHVLPMIVAGLVTWRQHSKQSELILYAATIEGVRTAEARRATGTARPGTWSSLLRRYRLPAGPAAYGDAWLAAFSQREIAEPANRRMIEFLSLLDCPEISPGPALNAEPKRKTKHPKGK